MIKRINKSFSYILFLFGMIIVLCLCFGFVYIFAAPDNPVDGQTPGQTNSVQGTIQPSGSPPPSGSTPSEDQTTQETSGSPTRSPIRFSFTISIPVRSATPSSVVTKSPTSSASAAPSETPVETPTPVTNPSPVTMGPIGPDDMLPGYKPEIVSKSKIYNSVMEKDLNGYVIKIAASWNERKDSQINEEEIAAFEKKYNCKVVFLDLSKETIYNRLLISRATGITYFDAILTDTSEILVNFEPLGLLDEFSKYLTDDEIATISESYKKILSTDGKLYGIPAHSPDFSGIWYNKSLINKYAVPDPLKIYNDNKWYWNNFMSILSTSTGDITADGEYDLFGLAASKSIYPPVLESAGGSIFRWTGKEFISGLSKNVSVNGLEFVKDVYANGYIPYGYETYFYLEQACYFAGESSMYKKIKQYLTKSEINFLPYPSAEEGKSGMTVANYADCAAIVRYSRYPAHTAEILKILYSGSKFDERVSQFCEDNNFTKQITDVYIKMLDNFTIDYTKAFDKNRNLNNQLTSLLTNGTFSSEAATEKIGPIIDNLIKRNKTTINLKSIPVEIDW